MDLGLRGRSAVVGGASAGLGLAIAEQLASEGCRLVVWSHGSRVEDAARSLREKFGMEATGLVADARDADAADRVASEAHQRLGSVDIVVLNSGGPPVAPASATESEAWQAALQLLLLTPVRLASLLLPGMRERRWGRVVAVLSSGVRQPIPDLVYSNAGRSGLAAWLKTVANEVASDGITVNGVLPGRIATERRVELDRARSAREGRSMEELYAEGLRDIPAGRYGRSDEFAAAVTFLCSEPASYITGTLLPVDGGLIRGS